MRTFGCHTNPEDSVIPLPHRALSRIVAGAVAALAIAAPTLSSQNDSALVARARAIHNRVIKLDTHVDFSPGMMTDTTPNYVTGQASQVDLRKMRNGGMNGIFFSIFVGQAQDFSDSAYARARAGDVAKFEAVHRLAEKLAPGEIEIAYTAADVRRIHAKGKLIALMGVENGYGIGTDITNVKKFYDYGARYLSLAHNGHNQLSDSNTGEADNVWKWNGVSPLGKQVVEEANRYGIMLDISHPSKESNLWVMANSKAPVIASHSGARALCTTASRDLDDEQLLALKKNGGVMQTVAFAGYVKCDAGSPQRLAALSALAQEYGLPANAAGRGGAGGGGRGATIPAGVCGIGYGTPSARGARGAGAAGGAGGAPARGGRGGGRGNPLADMDSSKREEYQAKLDALNAKFPPPSRATVKDFVNPIDYAVKLIGIDHVGISSDFDGGGGIDGYNCTSEAINVTIELVRRGHTEKQIGQLWGGNVLRVMEDVEKAAKKIQSTKS
jgi:membrane dipeptidase